MHFRLDINNTPDDTSDTLDFDFMASVVKATVATVAKLADVRHSSAGIVSTFKAVEPAGKQPVTWGQIKSMADYPAAVSSDAACADKSRHEVCQ